MAHITQYKREEVQNLVNIISSNNVIGIVNIFGIPAAQMQEMRRKLRGKVTIRVVRNTLLRVALDEAAKGKKNVDALKEHIDRQTAILATNMNPFKLYKEMESTKTKAPAKGGEIAPDDIVVKAGETPFKPGPVVGELQKAGIPAAIEKGKVVIKSDKLLVKAGDKIPKEVAQMLTRLEIFPLTVGFDLKAAYENESVFKSDVLAVDEREMLEKCRMASMHAFNLAVFIAYATPLTAKHLICKAYTQALSLAVNANILTPESVKFFLMKAYSQMLSLASQIPESLDDDLRAVLSSQAQKPKEKKVKEKKKEKKIEEEKQSEEDAVEGLGALFD